MNKNVYNLLKQINNTLQSLISQGIVLFTIPCKVTCDKNNNSERIAWENEISGREVSSNAFNTIDQYMRIISGYSYQALLRDHSIIRCSFTFVDSKMETENLLWWPCPVKIDPDFENENGDDLINTVKSLLADKETDQYLNMRTPVRFDFDANNNSYLHPRAHVHMQHFKSRINCKEPMCFNRFMKFILDNYYPDLEYDSDGWDFLPISYRNQYETIDYKNKAVFLLH